MLTPWVAEDHSPKPKGWRFYEDHVRDAQGRYISREDASLSKARHGPGYAGPHDPATSMVERGGKKPYTQPTAEQVESSVARRKAQAAYKAGKPFRRVNAGKKVAWSVHRAAMGHSPEVFAPIIAGTAATGYLLHRRTEPNVAKRDITEKDKNLALGAAAGTGVGATAMQFGGQAAKIALKNRRAKRGESPNEQEIWRKHKAKYGNHALTPGGNHKSAWKSYIHYPKELPDWKGQRALAFKNHPAVSTGIVLAGTAAGLEYAHHRNKENQVSKSAFGVEHGDEFSKLSDTKKKALKTAGVVGAAGGLLVGRGRADNWGGRIATRVVGRGNLAAERVKEMKNPHLKKLRGAYAGKLKSVGMEMGRSKDTRQLTGRAAAVTGAGTIGGTASYLKNRKQDQ